MPSYDQVMQRGGLAAVSGPLRMSSVDTGPLRAVNSAPASGSRRASGKHAGAPVSEAGVDTATYTAEDFRNELKRVKRARRRNIVIVVIVIALVVAGIAAAVGFGASANAVSGDAMDPVLSHGQIVLTTKVSDIREGAVMAYHDEKGEVQFGRVVASPGNWVSVSPDGTVAVSDSALSRESARNMFGDQVNSLTMREVPEGSYYVLGDAENATADGLSSESDFVSTDQMLGEAVAKVWPITAAGPVAK